MKNFIAAAVLGVSMMSFAAPSQAFFLGGGMFSGGYDYVSRSANGSVKTAATDPNSLHAVKARLFSIGDDNLGDSGEI